MIESNEGHIVTIASQAGLIGAVKMTEYCATKFAVFGMNESIRREFKKMRATGVKTTVVCPGYINTGLFEGFKQSALANFISPPQTEENVARIIVESIEQQVEEVLIPKSFRNVFLFRFLIPSSWNDYLNYVAGGDNLMESFQGRPNEPK